MGASSQQRHVVLYSLESECERFTVEALWVNRYPAWQAPAGAHGRD